MRAVGPWGCIQAHGEAAPRAVLAASGSVMVGWGKVARGERLACNFEIGQGERAFVFLRPWRRSLRRRAVSFVGQGLPHALAVSATEVLWLATSWRRYLR
jgi:hypothetical protein